MININKYIKKNLLEVKVIPNASKTKIIEENNSIKVYLHAPPKKNKANVELIKFFKKEYNLKFTIKSGEKSREKVLQIL